MITYNHSYDQTALVMRISVALGLILAQEGKGGEPAAQKILLFSPPPVKKGTLL